MNFKYGFTLPMPVERAWPILLDLRRVAPCMPGAAIVSGDGDAYTGRMKVKLGPIEMTYLGDLCFLERDDEAHRLKVEGVGKEVRGGGGAKALVTVQAKPAGTSCEVVIDSEYTLSGKAAQFGTGMIDEIGAKLMKEFVTRLEKLILADSRSGAAVPGTVNAAPVTPPKIPVAAPASSPVAEVVDHDDNEALDLVGLAWFPVLKSAMPVAHLLISAVTLIYLVAHH